MNDRHRFTVGQWIGTFVLLLSSAVPGLALAGFHGGTAWSLVGWLFVSVIGGPIGGALLSPGHRFAGAVGGMIGAPLGLLALYFYARGRERVFRAEGVIIWLLGSLPGLGVFFVLKLLTDAIFPPRRPQREEEYEDDERPRRRGERRD